MRARLVLVVRLACLAVLMTPGCSGRKYVSPEGSSRQAAELPTVALTSYGVVADDPARASENRRAIQRAIHEQSGRGVVLALPPGAIYLDRGAHHISLRFSGVTDLVLAGDPSGASTIVIEGDALGGYWVGIEIHDGARRIGLRDFSIEHGPRFDNPSPSQQNHLIQLNAHRQNVSDVEIQHVRFGPCIGDALRILGTSPSHVERVKVHDFAMHTGGHPNAPRRGSRSGLSLQRGFKDVEVRDFYIHGAKNSPIDMEPSAAAPMEGLHIHDGVVDNGGGTTVHAVSLGGWEDAARHVTPLRRSSFRNVTVLEGQIMLVNTEGLELSDVTLLASDRGPMATSAAPMIYVFHHNANLRLRRVDMLRDAGAGSGALLHVSHGVETYPSNIEIEGGTWISRVDPEVKGRAYVSFESAQGVRMRDLQLRLEGPAPADKFGIRFRSSGRDVSDVELSGLRLEAPGGPLAAGVWLAATNNRTVRDVRITGVRAPGAAAHGVLFDATSGSEIEAAPVLEENDFSGAIADWAAVNFAATRVAPTTRRARPRPADPRPPAPRP
ncbi:MAG TPA: hypothetical protein VK932_04850 [Kofleriaceae bacterium]|nr:hypothetical protein [Kofleriaceae bacterium]